MWATANGEENREKFYELSKYNNNRVRYRSFLLSIRCVIDLIARRRGQTRNESIRSNGFGVLVMVTQPSIVVAVKL